MHRLRALIPSFLLGSHAASAPYTGPITQTAIESQLRMATTDAASAATETAVFANGCFWGTEHMFRKHFTNKGLIDAKVGYTGGDTSNPNYRQVCSGTTGHAEAVKLTWDPKLVTFATLVDFFYRSHDPTQVNRQGPDVGTQYRSGIFFTSPEQESIAKQVTADVAKHFTSPIATKILPQATWWDAEDYHQQYLHHNPSGYECPSHFVRTWTT